MSTAPTAAPGEDHGLIFQWDPDASPRWRLGAMLLLSFFAHAASFYVLQVAYTPTGSLLPPPAQVVLVPSGSAANTSLQHWIDMADPSLMTQARPPSPQQVLGTIGFRYVPSYATVLQVFKPLPVQETAEAPPRTRKPGPVPAGLLPALMAPEPGKSEALAGQKPASSRVVLSAGIAALSPRGLPPLRRPADPSAKPLEQTVFLVGVPPAGGQAWLFRQASSGDATENGADADAHDYLAQLQFKAPTDAGLSGPVWGWATFSWGRDAYP